MPLTLSPELVLTDEDLDAIEHEVAIVHPSMLQDGERVGSAWARHAFATAGPSAVQAKLNRCRERYTAKKAQLRENYKNAAQRRDDSNDRGGRPRDDIGS